MAKATYKRGEIRTVKYTTGDQETVEVDDIILMIIDEAKSRVAVARQNIAPSSTGIVAVSGVFEFPKDPDAVIKAGLSVNYDPDDDGDAWVQAFNATAPDNGISGFGCAMHDRAATTTTVDVDIRYTGIGDVTE